MMTVASSSSSNFLTIVLILLLLGLILVLRGVAIIARTCTVTDPLVGDTTVITVVAAVLYRYHF